MRRTAPAAAATVLSLVALAGCGPSHPAATPTSSAPVTTGTTAASVTAAGSAPATAPAQPPSSAVLAVPSAAGQPSASTAAPGAAGGVTPGTGLAAFYATRADWKPCSKTSAAVDYVDLTGYQCATVAVPLDYRHPTGRQIPIGIAKLPASGSQRLGSLLVDPGGPGESGLANLTDARDEIPAAVRAHFDIVGFDPRGVGVSAGLNCLSLAQFDASTAAPPAPSTPAEVSAAVARAALLANGCRATAGWELPYLGTTYAARDMDLIRSAVGDAKLTYLGLSYGTLLGAVYADEFPTNVRALVLDGALAPGLGVPAQSQEQGAGFEGDLRDFLADCVNQSNCPWQGSPAAARAGLDALLAKVSASPLQTSLGRQLHIGEAVDGVTAALYRTTTWSVLRVALTNAEHGDGTYLLEFSDSLAGRHSTGYETVSSAFPAISCADTPTPYTPAQAAGYAKQWAVASPLYGPLEAWGLITCDGWEQTATPLPNRVTGRGAPPIVVVGTTGDPATPYAWAQDLAGQLTSARLITYKGDGHTVYVTGKSACVTDAVNAYLVDLTPPPRGLQCS